jgi:phosphoribosylamine--glycine ligase
MHKLGVAQADSVKCFNLEQAVTAINERTNDGGIVIKARGLTGGKKVSVWDNKRDALRELRRNAKEYGPHVLIAERLFGDEYSAFGISDGERVVPIEMSFRDYKRLLEGDKGPNTGSMGAHGPVKAASARDVRWVADNLMTPVIRGMKERGIEFRGVLYAGIMKTPKGQKVIEFNARFGDPELQPAVMMIKSDLYEHLSNAVDGKLKSGDIKFRNGAACCVILTSKGYPQSYNNRNNGLLISRLDEASQVPGVEIFHSETRRQGEKVYTNGGRVLGVTGYSPAGIEAARKVTYGAIRRISVPGGFNFRTDIGRFNG